MYPEVLAGEPAAFPSAMAFAPYEMEHPAELVISDR
jgi:hypothetical protein